MQIERVGDARLGWGESLVWDERSERLFFVDCAAQTLHWLVGGEGELHTVALPTMAAGLVPAEDGALVGALHDGLHRIDPDAGTTSLVAAYPDELDGRCNDACADLAGNIITGKLNLGPDEGAAWWWSATEGWRMLDDDISNTNGPAVGEIGGELTLIIGDTSADYFSYPYDGASGTVGPRSVFGDTSGLDGAPDGATLDAEGGFWCALVGGGQLARFTSDGLDRTVPLPVANPTDVTFGGPDLDRLYVVSIAGDPDAPDGGLFVIDGVGVRGRVEPALLAGRPGVSAGAGDRFDLTGKVALVTGGSRGLGGEMVMAFAEAGADVVIASRKLDNCERVAAEVEAATGRSALAYGVHIGRWDQIPGLVDAAYERFGQVDVLVNNAGMSPVYPSLADVSEKLFDSVVNVNLKGPFRLSALVGPRMAESGGGSIINVSSTGSLRPYPGIAPYAASKAGLNALTQSLTRAFGPTVRVNTLMAGPFLTDISEAWDLDAMAEGVKAHALQRIGRPEEIVGAALYLASDASSYTSGATLRVDGGIP